MNGIQHIDSVFAQIQKKKRAALMPYFTLGFPTLSESVDIVQAIAGSGADLIELGIPFSDPLADGPTIQYSTQVALENGASVAGCLDMVREIRRRAVEQPLMLMGYYNPILAFGIQSFVAQAAKSGADGLIVPDLPLEESDQLEAAAQQAGLALIYLVAPTTPVERLSRIAPHSKGFLYLVSLTGVTGARQALPADLQAFVQRVRAITEQPLAVGFGISTPEQARIVGSIADGVIVGSALVRCVADSADKTRSAARFVEGLNQALSLTVTEFTNT